MIQSYHQFMKVFPSCRVIQLMLDLQGLWALPFTSCPFLGRQRCFSSGCPLYSLRFCSSICSIGVEEHEYSFKVHLLLIPNSSVSELRFYFVVRGSVVKFSIVSITGLNFAVTADQFSGACHQNTTYCILQLQVTR